MPRGWSPTCLLSHLSLRSRGNIKVSVLCVWSFKFVFAFLLCFPFLLCWPICVTFVTFFLNCMVFEVIDHKFTNVFF